MDYFEKLNNIYENPLNIPHNEACNCCDSENKPPLLQWQIGEQYFTKRGGIFIAGKPHRGTPGTVRGSGMIDGTEVGKRLFFDKSSPYWNYTEEALNSLFMESEQSWSHITFSNIVKCTSTNTGDKTSLLCANQCIAKNKVIFKEIQLLKPRKFCFLLDPCIEVFLMRSHLQKLDLSQSTQAMNTNTNVVQNNQGCRIEL